MGGLILNRSDYVTTVIVPAGSPGRLTRKEYGCCDPQPLGVWSVPPGSNIETLCSRISRAVLQRPQTLAQRAGGRPYSQRGISIPLATASIRLLVIRSAVRVDYSRREYGHAGGGVGWDTLCPWIICRARQK